MIIVLSKKLPINCFPFKTLTLYTQGLVFQQSIDNKCFSWPILDVNFTKNVIILSNSDFIIYLYHLTLSLSLILNLGVFGFVSLFSVKIEW